MKKLMFSLGAALTVSGAWAATSWIYNESVDLAARFTAAGLDNVFEVGANNGGTVNSYLGSDVSANAYSFATTSGTTFNFDLGGYTLTDTDSGLMFYLNAGPLTLNVSNGTIDGSAGGDFKLHADGAPKLTATFDGVTIKDYGSVNLAAQDGLSDSIVTFKGGSKIETSGAITCTSAKSDKTINNTVRFEGGTKVVCNGFTPMSSGYSRSSWNNQVVVTGEGTSISNIGGITFQDASGASLLIDDHATFFANAWPNLGLGSGNCTLTVANGATFTTHDFFIGANNADYPSQHNTLTVKDATIKVPNWAYSSYDHLFVGKYSDNNTLVLSNADATACAGIWIGGSWLDPESTTADSVRTTRGNAVYIYGNTLLPNKSGTSIDAQWPTFYSCDGLVCFNGFTDTTTWANEQLNLPSGDQVQARDGNEVRFENGSDVAINWINIASGHTGSKITIKDSSLFVRAKFDDYGSGTILELDNGQMTLDGDTPWNFYFNQSENATAAATCIFKGDHPQIWNKTADKGDGYGVGQIQFWTKNNNKMTIQVYLPNGARYQKPMILSGYVSLKGVGTIEIPNLAEARKTFTGYVDVPLAEATVSLETPDFSTVSLPEGCSLVRSSEGSAAGTLSLRVAGLPGTTYDSAFTSVAAYNAAITGDDAASYANVDTYVVLSNVEFAANTDYSFANTYVGSKPETVTQPKLHAFFYNCTFPTNSYGTMSGNGPSTPVSSGRKMIAINSVKELVVQGCTFPAFSYDTYVIDLNLFNWYEADGCGITIKGNTFKSGAGSRTPISVKNKIAYPPAFVLIEGNTFEISGDATEAANGVAPVICYGDQLKAGSTTANGCDFPITVQNNTFGTGVTQYKVMTGYYLGSGKTTQYVPLATSFTWTKVDGVWTAYPQFPGYYFEGGSGTEADPYLLGKADDFNELDLLLTQQNADFSGKYFKLSGPVTLTGWKGIGKNNAGQALATQVFNGTFDGNGQTITMTFDTGTKYTGLFNVTTNATIKNVNFAVSGACKGFGCVAGYLNDSTVENVTVTGEATGDHNMGAIAVKAAGVSLIKNCVNKANLTSANKVGGLVSFITEGTGITFENCSNEGTIVCNSTSTTGTDRGAGGLVGWAAVPVTFKNCSNKGSVTYTHTVEEVTTSDTSVGSLIGAFGKNGGDCLGATLTVEGCSAQATMAPLGEVYKTTGAITGLNWATVADGVATFCDTPTTAGTYTAMMSNADAITFGTASGDTLTIATREGVSYTGKVASAVAGCTVEGAAVEGGTAYTLVGDGLSYASAFTSIEQYNAAVNDALATYKDKDVYVVVKGFKFEAGVDYSLAHQSDVMLHLFFYNCTFPSENGTMNPSGPSEDVKATNRKMIAVTNMKELWVEHCEFNPYFGDSYVIDINTANTYENGGCGVTITNCTFAANAGTRVPLSIKNKHMKPLAFMHITGNTFYGTNDVAGVICFGDTSAPKGGDAATYYGANCPITIENNTFVDASTYKVMTGIYNATGSKDSIYIPTSDTYTWSKVGDVWAGSVAFPRTLADGVTAELTNDGACTINASTEGTTLTTDMLTTLGKSALKDVTIGANIAAVDAGAFAKCYGLGTVTFKNTGSVSVADNAFLRCNSLESIVFEGAVPELSDKAFTLQSAIYMKDGIPTIESIPAVSVQGYNRVIKASNDLTNWTTITTGTTDYHFFKVVYEKQ